MSAENKTPSSWPRWLEYAAIGCGVIALICGWEIVQVWTAHGMYGAGGQSTVNVSYFVGLAGSVLSGLGFTWASFFAAIRQASDGVLPTKYKKVAYQSIDLSALEILSSQYMAATNPDVKAGLKAAGRPYISDLDEQLFPTASDATGGGK